MTTRISEAGQEWASKLPAGVEPDEIDWQEVFEAGWKAAITAVSETLADSFSNFSFMDPEVNEPSDDFPLYLEYPQEDEGMYLNERLYGEE